jgi:regulator of replication initiation timing
MTADAQALADALARVEQLGQEIQDLRAAVAGLEHRVADLTAENQALRDQLDNSRRKQRTSRVTKAPDAVMSRGRQRHKCSRERRRVTRRGRCPTDNPK